MYGKTFASLWDGTLGESWPAWSTFVFMFANCDRDGVLEMTASAIARRSSIPLETVQSAIALLESPDPHSRSPECEGRRIVPLDDRGWGWRIVNYPLYRGLRDEDQRRDEARDRMRRKRGGDVRHCSPSVLRGSPRFAQAEAEAEAEAEESKNGTVCSEPAKKARRSEPQVSELGEGEPVVDIPTNRLKSPVTIRASLVAEWEETYPGVDVAQTLKECRQWCLANPNKCKTANGMRRFLNAWMAREQNKP